MVNKIKIIAKATMWLIPTVVFASFFSSCSQLDEQTPGSKLKLAPTSAWIDTVHFNSNLTDAQNAQVYFARNNEEDYAKVHDTARVMLRFFWWRAFHPYVVVRLENRPEIYDSSGTRRVYQEWFALYKQNISRLNHDCPVRIGDKCFGKPYPFVHQQHVEVLQANKTPAVIAALDSVGFWQMKPVYEAEPHTDGSNWMLEVYYKGRLKQVSTSRSQHPIKSLCLRLLKLSGYKSKPNEIY